MLASVKAPFFSFQGGISGTALRVGGERRLHIARELDVSYKTVLNVSWQLRRKLGVDNLPALVRRAVQLLGAEHGSH